MRIRPKGRVGFSLELAYFKGLGSRLGKFTLKSGLC